MHVGKRYKTAFRRDLQVFLDFPNLWPEKWVFLTNDVIGNTYSGSIPSGLTTDPPIETPGGDGLGWQASFTGTGGTICTFRIGFLLINSGITMDWIIQYFDTLGNSAQCTFHVAELNLQGGGHIGWVWDTSTPPPAFVNFGTANIRWLFPGGNDQFRVKAKLW